jgi:hypothetical protein
MSFAFLLVRIAQVSSLIPILSGISRYKKMPAPARLFFFFLVFSSFSEGMAVVLSVVFDNNMPFMYIFTAVEFGVFCYIFFPKLSFLKNRFKPAFYSAMLLMIALLIIDIVINSIWKLNTISKISECVLIVFIGLSYLLQYLQSDTSTNITKDYLFWIASGATLYFAISFFFFMMLNLLVTSNLPYAQITSSVHSIISVVANLFYAYSFWVVGIKPSLKR